MFNLGAEKLDDLLDILPADRTGVSPVSEEVSAGLAGGEVVTGGQEAVSLAVHTDDALLLQCHPLGPPRLIVLGRSEVAPVSQEREGSGGP